MAIQMEVLRSIPYCSGMGTGELTSISKLIFEKNVKPGEIILLEGEPAEALYFVVSGAVKVFKTSPEGREQILSIAHPQESFNDVPVFDGEPSHVSAEAMTSVVLYGIKRSDLELILQNYSKVAWNAIRVLAGQVRYLVSLVEDLSFKHVISRVAKILLEHVGDGAGPAPRLTQQDIAGMAGTAREVISRSLKALEEGGVIRLDRHRIVITNKQALGQIAGVAV